MSLAPYNISPHVYRTCKWTVPYDVKFCSNIYMKVRITSVTVYCISSADVWVETGVLKSKLQSQAEQEHCCPKYIWNSSCWIQPGVWLSHTLYWGRPVKLFQTYIPPSSIMNVIAFHFWSQNVTKDHVMQLHFLEMSNIDLTVYFEQYYLFI